MAQIDVGTDMFPPWDSDLHDFMTLEDDGEIEGDVDNTDAAAHKTTTPTPTPTRVCPSAPFALWTTNDFTHPFALLPRRPAQLTEECMYPISMPTILTHLIADILKIGKLTSAQRFQDEREQHRITECKKKEEEEAKDKQTPSTEQKKRKNKKKKLAKNVAATFAKKPNLIIRHPSAITCSNVFG
jgi:hypothetical protein